MWLLRAEAHEVSFMAIPKVLQRRWPCPKNSWEGSSNNDLSTYAQVGWDHSWLASSFYNRLGPRQMRNRGGKTQFIKRLSQQQAWLIPPIFGCISSCSSFGPAATLSSLLLPFVRKRRRERKVSVLRTMLSGSVPSWATLKPEAKENTEPVFIKTFDSWFTVDFFALVLLFKTIALKYYLSP